MFSPLVKQIHISFQAVHRACLKINGFAKKKRPKKKDIQFSYPILMTFKRPVQTLHVHKINTRHLQLACSHDTAAGKSRGQERVIGLINTFERFFVRCLL